MIADILFVLGVFIIGFSLGGSVAYWRWVKTCYSPSTTNVKWKGKEYRALEQGVEGLIIKYDNAKVKAEMDQFAKSAERYARGEK